MTKASAYGGPDVRASILRSRKEHRRISIAQLAQQMQITREAVRLHLSQMESDACVERTVEASVDKRVGRPTASYSLTAAGENLFPKQYDVLASVLVGAIDETLETEALERVR